MGIRKHRGIVQTGGNKGRLRKGYKYSGKKLKNGKSEIIKCKSKVGEGGGKLPKPSKAEQDKFNNFIRERTREKENAREKAEKKKQNEKTIKDMQVELSLSSPSTSFYSYPELELEPEHSPAFDPPPPISFTTPSGLPDKQPDMENIGKLPKKTNKVQISFGQKGVIKKIGDGNIKIEWSEPKKQRTREKVSIGWKEHKKNLINKKRKKELETKIEELEKKANEKIEEAKRLKRDKHRKQHFKKMLEANNLRRDLAESERELQNLEKEIEVTAKTAKERKKKEEVSSKIAEEVRKKELETEIEEINKEIIQKKEFITSKKRDIKSNNKHINRLGFLVVNPLNKNRERDERALKQLKNRIGPLNSKLITLNLELDSIIKKKQQLVKELKNIEKNQQRKAKLVKQQERKAMLKTISDVGFGGKAGKLKKGYKYSGKKNKKVRKKRKSKKC